MDQECRDHEGAKAAKNSATQGLFSFPSRVHFAIFAPSWSLLLRNEGLALLLRRLRQVADRGRDRHARGSPRGEPHRHQRDQRPRAEGHEERLPPHAEHEPVVDLTAEELGGVPNGMLDTLVPGTPSQTSRVIPPSASSTFKVSTADPLPTEFAADSTTCQLPAWVGVPEIRPVAAFTESPGGKFAAW